MSRVGPLLPRLGWLVRGGPPGPVAESMEIPSEGVHLGRWDGKDAKAVVAGGWAKCEAIVLALPHIRLPSLVCYADGPRADILTHSTPRLVKRVDQTQIHTQRERKRERESMVSGGHGRNGVCP